MELLKLKKNKNVYSIVKINDILLVSTYDGVITSYNFNNLGYFHKIEANFKLIETFKYNAERYYLSTRNKLFKMSNNEFSSLLEDYSCTNSLQVENYTILYKGKTRNMIFCVYSLSRKEILWELENISLYVIGDYCFSRKKTNFKAHNIETGAVLWDKNSTDDFEEAKTYKFLTVYNKVLVVAINDTILAGYNVNTGELLWQVKETNNRNLVMDNDGKLKGVTSTGYFETDIITGTYHRIEFAPFEAINKTGWFESQRDTFVIIDNYIITTDFYSNRIGAFNMETMQYDWFYTEENATGFPASRPVKYFEPYLCIIDNNDTLHIYEVQKQKNI